MRWLTLALIFVISVSAAGARPQPPAPASAQHFIYVLRPVPRLQTEANWTEQDGAVAQRHFAYLQGLTEKGSLVIAGRTKTLDAKTFGIVVFEAPSPDAARTIMESDPGVKEGIMTAEVFPYEIALQRKH